MSKLVVGNLKMNLLSQEEASKYLSWLKKEIGGKNFNDVELVVCPPFVHFGAFQKGLGKKVKLGAQNMFPEEKGSFTGEVSPIMLKNFGCEYVILGHSERRRYQGENGEEIGLKVSSAIKNGIKPIVCIGETKTEREYGQIALVIATQLEEALKDISRTKMDQVIIAYEPIWSVGTNDIPTSDEILSARLVIRKVLVEMMGKSYADRAKIIYGGSVSAKTVKQTCLDAAMDGVLIGRESLLPNELVKIAQIIDLPR